MKTFRFQYLESRFLNNAALQLPTLLFKFSRYKVFKFSSFGFSTIFLLHCGGVQFLPLQIRSSSDSSPRERMRVNSSSTFEPRCTEKLSKLIKLNGIFIMLFYFIAIIKVKLREKMVSILENETLNR